MGMCPMERWYKFQFLIRWWIVREQWYKFKQCRKTEQNETIRPLKTKEHQDVIKKIAKDSYENDYLEQTTFLSKENKVKSFLKWINYSITKNIYIWWVHQSQEKWVLIKPSLHLSELL